MMAIPKTMDNDVPGTDYCIGFSTCVTRTIEMTNSLRTSAGSHERFLVLEVFGRYAGFTAMLPTMAGAANRCVIPEHKFDMERLTELLMRDRNRNPSRYSVVLVSKARCSRAARWSTRRPPRTPSAQQAGRDRRPGFRQAEGAFAKVQWRKVRRCHQPEAGLPGSRRRPGRNRFDRADGIR